MKPRHAIRQDFIEQHLAVWRLSRGKAAREALVGEVSSFIWHYPGFAFRIDDEDRRGDFYFQVLEKFDRILEGYDEKRFPFATWLGACLRNTWINYASRSRDLACESLDARESYGEELADSGALAPPSGPNARGEERYRSDLQRLAVRLYHIDHFDEDDFDLLLTVTGRPLSICASFIEELLETVRLRRARQAHFENRLTLLYHRILRGQQALEAQRASGKGDGDREARLRAAEVELRRRQDGYLQEYRAIKVHPPARRIGEFLGINESRIRYWLQVLRTRSGAGGADEGPGSGLDIEAATGPRTPGNSPRAEFSNQHDGAPRQTSSPIRGEK